MKRKKVNEWTYVTEKKIANKGKVYRHFLNLLDMQFHHHNSEQCSTNISEKFSVTPLIMLWFLKLYNLLDAFGISVICTSLQSIRLRFGESLCMMASDIYKTILSYMLLLSFTFTIML